MSIDCRRRFRWWAGALAVVAAGAGLGARCVAQQPYQVLEHWRVGGVRGWDYLVADPAAHVLYVTHGPRVEVVDSRTGKVVGAVTGMKGTHGVALDDVGRYGYVSDGGSNAVVVFDRRSWQTVATIPAGTNPDGIVFDPSTKSVWAFNGGSHDATVIDTGSNRVVATVALPGKPEFPVADGQGSVYDNIESTNQIVRVDARTKQVVATWTLTGCDSPTGLAMDRAHRRLFAVCGGKKMAVVDADTGRQMASPEIGSGPDAAVFSAKRQLAFSSNGEGTLTVVDVAHGYETLETLPTARGARTMAYDEEGDRAFLVTAQFGPAPEATAEAPHPRPSVVPDTFEVLVVGRP